VKCNCLTILALVPGVDNVSPDDGIKAAKSNYKRRLREIKVVNNNKSE
jgi:hypothetical protein